MSKWKPQERMYFFMVKSKQKRFEVEEDKFYQIQNSTNNNGNSQHIKAAITVTVGVFENVKQQKDHSPDKQRDF